MDFSKPHEVSDACALMAFPGDVNHLMPKMEEIPEEFNRGTGDAYIWVKLVNRWFFSGLPTRPVAKEGIDLLAALHHIHCVMGSYQPKHEHKIAAVAYLCSLWLTKESAEALVAS